MAPLFRCAEDPLEELVTNLHVLGVLLEELVGVLEVEVHFVAPRIKNLYDITILEEADYSSILELGLDRAILEGCESA